MVCKNGLCAVDESPMTVGNFLFQNSSFPSVRASNARPYKIRGCLQIAGCYVFIPAFLLFERMGFIDREGREKRERLTNYPDQC